MTFLCNFVIISRKALGKFKVAMYFKDLPQN